MHSTESAKPSSFFSFFSSRKDPPKENRLNDLTQRAFGCLALGAVGDTLGFGSDHNPQNPFDEVNPWELSGNTPYILHTLDQKFGGSYRNIRFRNEKGEQRWVISDDTILHFLAAKTLSRLLRKDPKISINKAISRLAKEHVEVLRFEVEGPRKNQRCFGQSTRKTYHLIKDDPENWKKYIIYNPEATGNGAAMRSMIYGFFYPGEHNRSKLIAACLNSGFLSNPSIRGTFGALTTAALTSFALENIPVSQWIPRLFAVFEQAREYLKGQSEQPDLPPAYRQLLADCLQGDSIDKWILSWQDYHEILSQSKSVIPFSLAFPQSYADRDRLHKSIHEKIAGVTRPSWMAIGDSGDTAVMLAFQGLLAGIRKLMDASGLTEDTGESLTPDQLRDLLQKLPNERQEQIVDEIVKFTVLHGGDNDSTGGIALSLYGTLFGVQGMAEHFVRQTEIMPEVEGVARSVGEVTLRALKT